jgi:hypothetical protein
VRGKLGTAQMSFFVWLALQFRLQTSDQRLRHGLQDDVSSSDTCLQEGDIVNHILVGFVYSHAWWGCVHRLRIIVDMPFVEDRVHAWWLSARGQFRKKKTCFDTLINLVCWRLCKRRNARVLQNIRKHCLVEELINKVM